MPKYSTWSYFYKKKTSETLNYLHHDYLGSIVAISNEAGQVTERLAFDPWGKRRYPNGLPDANDNISESLEDLGSGLAFQHSITVRRQASYVDR